MFIRHLRACIQILCWHKKKTFEIGLRVEQYLWIAIIIRIRASLFHIQKKLERYRAKRLEKKYQTIMKIQKKMTNTKANLIVILSKIQENSAKSKYNETTKILRKLEFGKIKCFS